MKYAVMFFSFPFFFIYIYFHVFCYSAKAVNVLGGVGKIKTTKGTQINTVS